MFDPDPEIQPRDKTQLDFLKIDCPIPYYADLMPMTDFVEAVKSGLFSNDDGTGHYASLTRMSYQTVDCRYINPWRSSHIAWFNK